MANLTAIDIRHPRGWVKLAHFPDETDSTLNATISTWLGQAYADARVIALTTEAARNAAARLFAYWKAADQLDVDTSADPSHVTLSDQGTKLWAADQRLTWKERAAKYEAAFEAAVVAPVVASGAPVLPTYVSAVNKYVP